MSDSVNNAPESTNDGVVNDIASNNPAGKNALNSIIPIIGSGKIIQAIYKY